MNLTRIEDIVGPGPLLLDFDGPVCSVFAGLPAPRVAAELVNLLRAAKVVLPDAIAAQPDPLAVLRWTGEACEPKLTEAVEDALCSLELRAVDSASPTPFGRELILAARLAGLPVAVVSNNSAPAVRAYLTAHGLIDVVAPIIGRPYALPQAMKPSPTPILEAVRALGANPALCVLIGDSFTDIEGARAAGVRVIGYANRPEKLHAMAAADVVVTSMAEIVRALTPYGSRPSERDSESWKDLDHGSV